MAKSKRKPTAPQQTTLEAEVKAAVRLVWCVICPDVGWPVDATAAADLCLDADRPVTLGRMSTTTYRLICNADPALAGLIDQWAADALRPLL
jgi:hypothetical protein